MSLTKIDEQQTIIPVVNEFDLMVRMATALYGSGILPDHIKNARAAFAIIQKGRELQIPPMQALNNIYVIHGKASANSELMLALIFRAHGGGAITWKQHDAQACVIVAKRKDSDETSEWSFTMQDALTAGLPGGANSATWKKYPAAMLRARCISAMARAVFPDCIGGMYTPEELDVVVDEEGNFVPERPQRARMVEAHHADPDKLHVESIGDIDLETGEISDSAAAEEGLGTWDGKVGAFVDDKGNRTAADVAQDVASGDEAAAEQASEQAALDEAQEAIDAEEAQQSVDNTLVNPKQIARIWATAREFNWEKDDVHGMIGAKFPEAIDPQTKAPSVKQLTVSEMERFIKILRAEDI